jgi:hypothetical protein
MTLKVIGAGFGRTGTNTLREVLNRLGFGPCYHMYEVIGHPDRIAAWQGIADGGMPDWDAVYEGYNAAVDWPTARFWRELAAHYPEAKIILTERDPDAWFASISKTIFETFRAQQIPEEFRTLRQMTRKLIFEDTFGGEIEDKAHVIDIYKKHNAEVRAAFGADRLLVFNPSEGWEPLCAFLGVPVPDEPFPHTNTTADFLNRRGKLDEAE